MSGRNPPTDFAGSVHNNPRSNYALDESSFLSSTGSTLDMYIAQGQAVLGNLGTQRDVLKGQSAPLPASLTSRHQNAAALGRQHARALARHDPVHRATHAGRLLHPARRGRLYAAVLLPHTAAVWLARSDEARRDPMHDGQDVCNSVATPDSAT